MKNVYRTKRQGLTIKGSYVITKALIETPEQKSLSEEIERLSSIGEDYIHLVRQLNELCKVKIYKTDNIITTAGFTLIANNLASNSPTNDPKLNYGALGGSAVAPAIGQTMLGSELFRKRIVSISNNAGVVNLTAYYSATDTEGTFKEHAIFADASDTANSGVMFSRVLLDSGTGIAKSLNETLTLDYTITIS